MSSVAPPPSMGRPRDNRDFGYEFTPQAHTRTARGMQRRRTILSALFWTAGAGVVVSSLVFLFYAGMFDFDEPSPPQLGEGEQIAETLTMGQLQFNGFDKKNQAYALAAETAQQDRDNPNIIHLTNVRAELKLAGTGDVIMVRADRGTYDTEAETMSAEQNIRLVTTQGYSALLETATVTLKDGVVVSDDPVVVNTGSGTLWANGIRMRDNGRQIEFTNRVRVEFDAKTDSGRSDAG